MHDHPSKGTYDKGQHLTNEEPFDMKPVIMVLIHHVLCPLENKVWIMAEPNDIQDDQVKKDSRQSRAENPSQMPEGKMYTH